MEILLTGFTAFLTQEWIETAFPNDHVLTTCAKGEALSDTQIKTVTLESRQLLDQLAETYQFDRVVYFSEYLLPHGDQEGELDRLRRVLQSCREREVELLYLSGPEAAFAPSTGKTLLANAAEELCFHYARTSKLQVKVFRLPYLYAVSASGADQFARLFEQMPAGTVQMDEQAAQPLLALCAEELADLVARVFDTWTPEPERFTLPDVFGNTQGQLGEVLQKLQPGLKVLYGTDTIQTYPAADNAVRRRYGWFQRYSILDDLPAIYNAWCARKTEKKSFIRKMVDKIRRSSLLLRLVEIAAAWLATELLVRITGTDAQFRMVDFRLMFVVLIGTVYGLNAGVLSAVLASVSLTAGYLRQSTTLMLLFYEPANWLAFIIYFVVGASCGYVQLRNTETARFVQEENELLHKRLEFTRKLYQDTLEDKRSFRRQILGRRDSFGKIYAVTQQLDMLQPQEICRKTVQIMEDVLENHSLTIYRMEKNQGFARLTAASAGMTPEPAYSLEVDQWLDVIRAIEQEGLWVNRGFLPGRPMYAAGVRQNGSLVVLIGLYTASEEQMTLYYQNLFRILCGLVETALVRAFEYESVGNTILMILLYFTDYGGAVAAAAVFAVSASGLTALSMALDPAFYGFGFLIGAALFYLVTLFRLDVFTANLPYRVLGQQPIVAETKAGRFTRLGLFLEHKKRKPTKSAKHSAS